jgi:ParB-like chromosome segregation protein Spo0J
MVALAQLIPYDKNARRRSDRAIEIVAKSLRKFGWRQPIAVDRESTESKGTRTVWHLRADALSGA